MNSDHIEVSTSQVADVRDGSLTSVTTLSSPPLPHSSTDPSSTVTTGPAPPPTPECELRSRSLLLHTPSGPVRVDPVAPGDLVTETFPPPPPSDPVEVSLHTSLPYGRVFSAFAATAAVGEGVEVVAKIAHASPAVREEVAWEAWLYVQRLIIPVVPHFHGLFAGGGHLVALLEPVGHEVVVGALSVSEQ
ncbi:hypothetical protein CC85DRAFT_284572 [Cutaneotrichosporon oleaginosum]|uniref:Protein kinase domain-containing protein n=1 Tax=Cutaneotrichosporon oleaginosum TaxID=879819 RepID=A0A0J0XQR3_9TREE|nr:uncharacterized protein CC85DRAFT_284572 [Cutaneotrichosporon oleaginosum]KLT43431.1 hypothetical protein CC85DRAFT_284572 [Cutaneotrichosporon oleaginosum]TXT05356.1 hypothetical protein COLE_06676 [Cutaneotrichosporon oleaginosum]